MLGAALFASDESSNENHFPFVGPASGRVGPALKMSTNAAIAAANASHPRPPRGSGAVMSLTLAVPGGAEEVGRAGGGSEAKGWGVWIKAESAICLTFASTLS